MGICGSSSRDTVIIPNKFNDDENKQNPNSYQNNLSGNIKERKKSENDEFKNKKHDKIFLIFILQIKNQIKKNIIII